MYICQSIKSESSVSSPYSWKPEENPHKERSWEAYLHHSYTFIPDFSDVYMYGIDQHLQTVECFIEWAGTTPIKSWKLHSVESYIGICSNHHKLHLNFKLCLHQPQMVWIYSNKEEVLEVLWCPMLLRKILYMYIILFNDKFSIFLLQNNHAGKASDIKV